MDRISKELQFIDLSDTSESERDFLQSALYIHNPDLKYPTFPWTSHEENTDTEWRSTSGAAERCVAPVLTPQAANCSAVLPAQPVMVADPVSSGTASVYQEQVPVMTVPPPIPSSTPAPNSGQPAMTTVYQMLPGMPPLSSVYVSNVSPNVNVHGYMNTPLSPYHIQSQHVYHPSGDIPGNHESSSSGRNGNSGGSRDAGCARRGRGSKPGSKRADGQFTCRNAEVDSQSAQSNPSLTHSSYGPPMFPLSPMHHYAQPTAYYPAPSHPQGPPPHMSHPSAQHAAGQPIYLPSPVPMYPPPALYNTYPPAHLYPAGPVQCSDAAEMASFPLDESVPKIDSATILPSSSPQQRQTVSSGSVHLDRAGVKTSRYHQQQSEEEDFNQTNLVTTVVVNNSKIAPEPSLCKDTFSNKPIESVEVSAKISQEIAVRDPPVVKSSVQKDTLPSLQVLKPKNGELIEKIEPCMRNSASVGLRTISLPAKQGQLDKTPVEHKSTSQPTANVSTSLVASPKPAVDPACSPPASAPGSKPQVRQTNGSSVSSSHKEATKDTSPNSTAKSWASLFHKSSAGINPAAPPFHPASLQLPVANSSKQDAFNKASGVTDPFQTAVPITSVQPQDSANKVTSPRPAASPPAGSPPFTTHGEVEKNAAALPAPILADDPNLHKLGEFLVRYQLEHKAISLQPRGLTNRCNWCYINSTLQALLACPPFYNLMKSLPVPARRSGKSATPIIDSMVQFVNEFVPLSAAARLGRKEKAMRKEDGGIDINCGAAFEPSYIYKMLNSIRSDTFKVEGRQEDAEEFLSCLLNGLNDEMLEVIKLVDDPSAKPLLSNGDITANGDSSSQSQDEYEAEWKVMGPKNKGSVTHRTDFGRTPISDIFRGQQRSRVQRAGDQSTDNVQPFFTLQLDIEKAQSVKDALEIMVGKDQLEGVTCLRTNQEIEAWQQVTLEELPLVLVLHLKWFDYKTDGCTKIVDKTVEFPIDLKVDGKLMSSNKKYSPKQKQYKLFAVVYHDGKEATKGHYITDVFHVGYGGWVRYDDSVVKAVQESQVLCPRVPRVPYLLYYRRFDTIGPVNSVSSAASVTEKVR